MHWLGGWVGPRTGLDALDIGKHLDPERLPLDRPARSPVTIVTELFRLKYGTVGRQIQCYHFHLFHSVILHD
jgi:hypothetical protein